MSLDDAIDGMANLIIDEHQVPVNIAPVSIVPVAIVPVVSD